MGNEWLARGVVQRVAIFRVTAVVQPGEDLRSYYDLVILPRRSSKLYYGARLRLYWVRI